MVIQNLNCTFMKTIDSVIHCVKLSEVVSYYSITELTEEKRRKVLYKPGGFFLLLLYSHLHVMAVYSNIRSYHLSFKKILRYG